MAEQQGQFDVEAGVGFRSAPPCLGAPHSVLNSIEMQGQFVGGKCVTSAAVEKHSQCFPQPRIVVGVGG
jgi:hypothetical protein